MGTAGLIFGAITVAWIAYLVPWFLGHRDQSPARTTDPADTMGASMRIVRPATAHLSQPLPAVSTTLTRRATVRQLRVHARRAARRRAVILGTFALVDLGLLVSTALGRTPGWSVAVATALLAAAVLIARVSVRLMTAHFDAQLEALDLSDDEATVTVLVDGPSTGVRGNERSVPVFAPPPAVVGSLWDPIPVTPPTYVSKPLAARTVRTIDLSAPQPVERALPVVADPDVEPYGDTGEGWRRATGS